MKAETDFLIKNYFKRYKLEGIQLPSSRDLSKALLMHRDKIVVIRKDLNIVGIGIYLKLSDESYSIITADDIRSVDTMAGYLKENGRNIHFITLTADCLKTILLGLNEVVQKENAKTVSWFSPDMKKLHKYNLTKEE